MKNPHWQIYRSSQRYNYSQDCLTWLIDKNSLTERLQKMARENFRVNVLCQQKIIFARRAALLREVQLLCDETVMVYAQSIFPLTTLTGKEKILAHLGTRSLGEYLFKNNAVRGPIEIAYLHPGMSLYETATQTLQKKPETIWARRSNFYLRNKPLLVCEVFLHL